MYKLVFPIIVFLFWSCNSAESKGSTESFGENKSEGSVASCLCTELIQNAKGELEKDGKLFTGNCFLNYENSDIKYIEKQLVNGLINGMVKYFSKEGEIIFEEKFEKGSHQVDLEIENIRCDCSLLSKKDTDNKSYYKGQLFKGTCFSLFPLIEQPYIEVSYQGGLRDGFTTYYSKIGDILYIEKYEKGELIKTIYPKK